MRRRAAAGAVLGLIAAAYAVLIFRNVSYAAGGPDESGYMNEARMLRAGRAELAVFPLRTMRLDRSFIDVFNPLGFVPTARGTIVPAYPPGYPIHLMLASFLGGWERAPFYVAPLAAIGAILLMFGVARELGLPFGHAVGAAAILAVFPTFAEQSLQVMSDVPATFWALMTIWLALRRNPVAAGMAFGVAVWVRPTNLLLFVPLAIILGRHIVRAIAGALPFGVLLLIFNATLYGNPFRTGYGSVTENLSFSAPCLATQTLWLAKLLTPLVLPGGLLVSFDRRVELRQRILLPAWFAVFLLFYALWAVCDAWWYTRFLLPAVPALILGTLLLVRQTPKIAMVVFAIVFVVCGRAWEGYHILRIDDDQVIYPRSIAVAERALPRNALVVSGLLSGAFMNYSNRFTARWDRLDADRFQLMRAYAGDAHLRWYAVLSEVEVSMDEFRRRLPGTWTPIARYRNVVVYRLDD